MVHTMTFEELSLDNSEGSAGHGCGQVSRGSAPPPPPRPPVSLEQLLATHNDLMRRLFENDEPRGDERQQPRHQERDSSYSNFLATHPPVFNDATDPLEADSWLCTTESMFELFKRLCTLRNSLEVQLEHGGLPTSPPYLFITMLHGMTSVLSSVHITHL
jgi:hypothetical protein